MLQEDASDTVRAADDELSTTGPRRRLRLLCRVLLLVPFTALTWTTLLLSLLVLLPFRRLRRATRRRIFLTWSRVMLRILGIRLEVSGPAPPAACLLVCNHLSYTDILAIAAQVPARFVAKSEIRSWPLAGWICASVSTIFVDRGSRRDTLRVGQLMTEALRAGDSVVVFPEGTSTHGHRVAPFKPALLAPAASRQIPVHYSILRYRTDPPDTPAHLSVCWWGNMPFAPHLVEMLQLRRVVAQLHFGEQPITGEDRKALAARLHTEICDRFEPVVDHLPLDPSAAR